MPRVEPLCGPGISDPSALVPFLRPCQVGLFLLLSSLVGLWWRQQEVRQRTIRAMLEAAGSGTDTVDLAEADLAGPSRLATPKVSFWRI